MYDGKSTCGRGVDLKSQIFSPWVTNGTNYWASRQSFLVDFWTQIY